jgi:RimJ/RimL family protein N-acetyltransferase
METENACLQPMLNGPTLQLRPLRPDDVEDLYQAASDPLIWAQHPSSSRYQRPVFQSWFEEAIASAGALAVIDREKDRMIGTSRYYDWDLDKKEIAIGFTFLARAYWGGAVNAELKRLMLEHAFQWARTVWFHIAPQNLRSRKAMEKIGGKLAHQGIKHMTGGSHEYCFYKIEIDSFRQTQPRQD